MVENEKQQNHKYINVYFYLCMLNILSLYIYLQSLLKGYSIKSAPGHRQQGDGDFPITLSENKANYVSLFSSLVRKALDLKIQ